jgi:hypothetical protein
VDDRLEDVGVTAERYGVEEAAGQREAALVVLCEDADRSQGRRSR